MLLLKGSEVANNLKNDLVKLSDELKIKNQNPTLGIIRVGNNESDLSYLKGISKKFQELNIKINLFEFPENITQNDFNSEFDKINLNNSIHGILMFRPLPKNLNDEYARKNINPLKDVDCMGYINLAKLFAGEKCFYPCTPAGIIEILKFYNIDLTGLNVVIIGRSLVIGKPLAMMLLKYNATVTVCHSKTKNLNIICKNSDLIITAAGHANLINKSFVNENSIIIDAGINFYNNKLCGDVNFQEVSEIVKSITPVPGGVGSVTTSILAKNLLNACSALI